MRKLIHSSFELDLTHFKISDTEENNWFSDSFFLKYSFPFDIDLENDLDIAFGFISQYNSDNVEIYFDLLYVHGNKIEKAVLEVESFQEKLSCTLRFGFEQLPSFEKKLSELSLENFELPEGTTVYEHAESIITQTWPDVNYNYPQIHVDKYDTSEVIWENFGSILNNRVSGAFLENTVDTADDVTYNRNIIQPLPYFIHILQRGMIDAGYELSGKIMLDDRIKKACLYGDVDNFIKLNIEDISLIIMSEDAYEKYWEPIGFGQMNARYEKTISLPVPGKYNIVGSVFFKGSYIGPVTSEIIYKGNVLYSFNESGLIHESGLTKSIDVIFETTSDLDPNEIIVKSSQKESENLVIFELDFLLLRANDSYGVPSPSIINENKVDLKKAVPDMTFGDFVKVIKNWFNYDLDIIDNLAVMNPIEDEINYNNAEDLQFSEIKKPLRKFSQGNSFLLKFQDIESKDYKYESVYQNKDGILNSNYTIDDKTTTIEINALPLPLLTRNGVQTAYGFESNDSKVFLVKYDGLYNGKNIAKPIIEYLIPAVHLQYWNNWFNFRIFSQAFIWVFKAWDEQMINIKAKRKIFAYNRYHIIKNINKTETIPEQFSVEIETNTLK